MGITVISKGLKSFVCFKKKPKGFGKEGAMAFSMASATGSSFLLKGRFFSISAAKAKSRAAGVLRGGVEL